MRKFFRQAWSDVKKRFGIPAETGPADTETTLCEASIDRLKKQSDDLIKARRLEAARFSPRPPRTSETLVRKDFPGSQALTSIFDFLQRLTLAAGLGVLAQVIKAQNIDLAFGVFFSEFISVVVAICALLLSLAITIELIAKNIPKTVVGAKFWLIYVTGSVFILVVMALFQAAVYSLAKDLPTSKDSISLSHEYDGKKVEIVITGDPDLKSSIIQIHPISKSIEPKPEVNEEKPKID